MGSSNEVNAMHFDAVKHRFKPLSEKEIQTIWMRLRNQGMASGSMFVEDVSREETSERKMREHRANFLAPKAIKRLRQAMLRL